MRRWTTTLYGAFAYLAFLIPTAYLVGFLADVGGPKTVDRGAGPFGPPLLVDVLLLVLFGLQHSVMARPGFKRAIGRWVPRALERSTYVLASGVTLLVVYALWRPVPAVVWDVSGTPMGIAAWVAFAAGWALAVCATFALSHLRLFGLAQVSAYARGDEEPRAVLRSTVLYRVVRHPMTLGLLVVLWSTPRMTLGHLVFAAGMSLYCLLATALEEGDLLRRFGSAYEGYRRRVPALVPILRPGTLLPRGGLWPELAVVASALGLVALLAIRSRPALAGTGTPSPTAADLPRLEARSVEAGGMLRSFHVFDPDKEADGPRALVLALHGTGGSARRFQTFLGGALEKVASERGWILAYPEAVEGAWNDCRAAATSPARTASVDDVAFLRLVIGWLQREHDVDPGRVFLLGFSGGGHMAFRVALESGELVRAMTVFSANLPAEGENLCTDRGRNVPIQIVNGSGDLVNPYGGGEVLTLTGRSLGRVRSARATADYFRERSPSSEVTLVTIEGGGHAVPGPESRLPRIVGRVDRAYRGVQAAAAFFARHLEAPRVAVEPASSGEMEPSLAEEGGSREREE